MLNSIDTNHTKSEHKHSSSRLKRILQSKSNVSPMPQRPNSKDLDQHQHRLTQISSPVLQHSTTLYSLASPTRTSFEIKSNSMDTAAMYYDLYQPMSPPPPIPVGHGRNPRQVPSSSSKDSRETMPSSRSRRSHSLHHTNHPTQALFTQSATTLPPLPPTPTTPASMKKSVTTTTASLNTNGSEKKDTTCHDDKNLRRHSCSSTAHHQHHSQHHQRYRSVHQQTPPLPSPSAAAVAAALASLPSPTSPSSPSLLSSATSIASSSNSSLLSKAYHVNKEPSSSSTASSSHVSTNHHQHYQTPSMLKLEKSKSTPLRPHSKIKTYNVSPPPSGTTAPHHRSSVSSGNKKRLQRYGSDTVLPSASQLERDLEKKKRQQELEDLISGRRGSTLKLSLTPKNTLLN